MDTNNEIQSLLNWLERLRAVRKAWLRYPDKKNLEGFLTHIDANPQEAEHFRHTARFSVQQEPVPAWEVSNLSQRIKGRQKTAMRNEMKQDRQSKEFRLEKANLTVTLNSEIDRLQIMFDGRPASNICSELHSRGFHWSPTRGVWQRQWTKRAEWSLGYFLSKTIGIDRQELRDCLPGVSI